MKPVNAIKKLPDSTKDLFSTFVELFQETTLVSNIIQNNSTEGGLFFELLLSRLTKKQREEKKEKEKKKEEEKNKLLVDWSEDENEEAEEFKKIQVQDKLFLKLIYLYKTGVYIYMQYKYFTLLLISPHT